MGNSCDCCPFFRQQEKDSDTLSQNNSVINDRQIEIIGVSKKMDKKLNDHTVKELKRQESSFFRKNALLQSRLLNQQSPFLYGGTRELSQKQSHEESVPYLNRVKSRIRPKVTKTTTAEADDNGQYFAVKNGSDLSSQERGFDRVTKFEEGSTNLTFSHPPPPVVLEDQYRTAKNQHVDRPSRGREQFQKLQSKLSEEEGGIEKTELYNCYMDLARYKLKEKELTTSQVYVTKALEMLQKEKVEDREGRSFKTYMLAGSVFFLQEKMTEALDYLLKTVRLQISSQGTSSMRLVEAYYWLGEIYNALQKYFLAKNYYTKAYGLYQKHEMQEHRLLASICLRLGKANNRQKQFAEADRFYERGGRAAEDATQVQLYIETLLKMAENQIEMENQQKAMIIWGKAVKIIKKSAKQGHPIYKEAADSILKSFGNSQPLQEDKKSFIIRIIQDLDPTSAKLSELLGSLKKD